MILTNETLSHLTVAQVRLIAEDFIVDHVGDQVMAGEPWPIRSSLGSAWVTPLVLTASAHGPLGTIGVLVIDDSTEQVIALTPQEMLAENSQRLYEDFASHRNASLRPSVTPDGAYLS